MQGVWVRSLVGELTSHMPGSQKNRSNIVANSIKTLKMGHIKTNKQKKNKEQFKSVKDASGKVSPNCLLC